MGNVESLVVVYEPDVAMLRAVLERIDHTAWLSKMCFILADGSMDRPGLTGRIDKFSGMLTQGTILVTHPPTRQLNEEALKGFGQTVAEVLEFCRTNMATALVNTARTYRNLSTNLPYYSAGETVNDLVDSAKGCAAVCVGAGPSLSKNIDLLADPKHRKNVVVISVQTMLKPLLARGIRPDYVTALDYHEISKRFYEGLPELPDVTLVAEPLVNPTVLDSYPGPVRITNSGVLDVLLGDLTRPMVEVTSGATVSHLAFYLAQLLGCDPIILVGMDLGFSDGLYYFPGTAIHDVWAPELNQFNTLEMMEWQRIVRHRGNLKKMDDIHGRSIYSDEQMVTYLRQFERDFANATQFILDATEGGLPKQHTTTITLAEALTKHATHAVPPLPQPTQGFDRDRLDQTAKLLRQRRAEVSELRRLSRETIPLLRLMISHQHDQKRLDKDFERLAPIQRRVNELSHAFTLVNNLNTVGAFKRARTDRAIDNAGLSGIERQRRQLERDVENVDWLVQACDELLDIIRDALRRVEDARGASTPSPTKARAQGKATLQASA